MLEYWKTQADNLAERFGIPMAVVEMEQGHYQVWSKGRAKGNYVYATDEREDGNGE